MQNKIQKCKIAKKNAKSTKNVKIKLNQKCKTKLRLSWAKLKLRLSYSFIKFELTLNRFSGGGLEQKM